jgi:4-hydroxymandelate oxidase
VLDGSITWDDVAELAASAELPLLAKGVLDPEDAKLAVEAGVAGVVVSNHGARQLDTVLPTAAVLQSVADAVDGRIDVLVDGGIQRGTDAVKALALGANGVLVGRQMLWALACGGAAGARRGLEMLVEEFGTALAIIGYTRTEDLDRTALLTAPWAPWINPTGGTDE